MAYKHLMRAMSLSAFVSSYDRSHCPNLWRRSFAVALSLTRQLYSETKTLSCNKQIIPFTNLLIIVVSCFPYNQDM